MKKLLSLSPAKILVFCGLGLALTLGAFWHHQTNQTNLDRMNVLNQGIGTCFNRISQTFTAMMIRDVQSPYLNQGFMSLSDECLNETIKGINPFRQNVGKGYETLNQLISEVNWFHEKVIKMHAPMLAGQNLNAPLAPIADRYSKMENFKVNLIDEVESTSARLRSIQANDEILMGSGLILFVIALSLLSLQEFNRLQLQRAVEKEALNHLKAGKAHAAALVDRLVDRALTSQNMPVTAQIFRDYHGDILEGMSTRSSDENVVSAPVKETEVETSVDETPVHKTSLKEVLVTLQNIHPKDLIQLTDVRDVVLKAEFEHIEQMMNAAVNKLASRRQDNKKIMITNQVHSDRAVISLFLQGGTFSDAELIYQSQPAGAVVEGLDMNMIVLKEMVGQVGAGLFMENKKDRQGTITGMTIRFTVSRMPKESKSKLVSVMRGKKKDLARELMN